MKLNFNLLKYVNVFRAIGDALSNNYFIKKLALKYPRLYEFSLNRVSLQNFNGLPLTLLLASFIANLLLLTEIIESFENSILMLSIDKWFGQFLFNIRISGVAYGFFYFSKLGSLPMILIIASIAVLFFIIQRKFVFIIPLLITLAGTGLTILIGKIYFHRERPNVLAFYNEPSYSFPSGHATVSVAFYGLLFYFIIRNVKNIKHKFQLIAVSLLFILLLGFSRLYLCVHYLSDVAAGYSLGLLWLLLAISIIEWKIYNKQNT